MLFQLSFKKFVFYPVNGLWDRPVKVPKWQPFWDYPAKMKASCLEKRKNFRRATFRIDPSFNWNILTMDNFCDIVIDGDFSPCFFFAGHDEIHQAGMGAEESFWGKQIKFFSHAELISAFQLFYLLSSPFPSFYLLGGKTLRRGCSKLSRFCKGRSHRQG